MLRATVQATTAANVSLPGSFSSMTITMKTMLANPRGPNQPMNSFESTRIFTPIRHRNTGIIRTIVRLRTA